MDPFDDIHSSLKSSYMDFYFEVSDFILEHIKNAPTPEVAYYMSNMLYNITKELFINY